MIMAGRPGDRMLHGEDFCLVDKNRTAALKFYVFNFNSVKSTV